jgi:hypothetical protein
LRPGPQPGVQPVSPGSYSAPPELQGARWPTVTGSCSRRTSLSPQGRTPIIPGGKPCKDRLAPLCYLLIPPSLPFRFPPPVLPFRFPPPVLPFSPPPDLPFSPPPVLPFRFPPPVLPFSPPPDLPFSPPPVLPFRFPPPELPFSPPPSLPFNAST